MARSETRESPLSHADLEIRILEPVEGGYPVEITFRGDREFPRGYLRPDLLPWPWVPGSSPAADGERLFRLLFDDPRLFSAWSEARGESPNLRLRLRLDEAIPELHTLPWELLREPGPGGRPLAASAATPFSRYLAGRSRGGPVRERPIRMLAAIADPEGLEEYDLPRLDVDGECQILREALGEVPASQLELTFLPAPVTLAALEAELRRGYQVLHLTAHGVFSSRRGQACLFLADGDGRVARVDERALAAMIARQAEVPRLVFLASCQSAARSPAEAFRGLAPRLVEAGVPAVLAMQDRMPVVSARALARVFYSQLLRHGRVDLAANEARSALLAAELPGSATPVLFLRLRDGVLLRRPDPERQRRRRRRRTVVGALATAAALASLVSGHLLLRSEREEHRSFSNHLAAEAKSYLEIEPELALLLSLEAERRAATRQSRDSLLAALAAAGVPLHRPLAGQGGAVTSLAFRPDGRWLAAAGGGGIRLHDVVSGEPLGDLLPGGAGTRVIAFHPEGGVLAAGGEDGRLRLWDTVTHAPLAVSSPGAAAITALAFSPDGESLATGGEGGDLAFRSSDNLEALTRSPEAHEGAVTSLAFSPKAALLASAGRDGKVRLWNVLATAEPELAQTGVAVPKTRTQEPARLHPLRTLSLPGGSPVSGLVFTPDGEAVVVEDENGRVFPFLVSTGELFGETLDSYAGATFGAALSADGATFALGCGDGGVLLGDAAHRTRLGLPLPGHAAAVLAVAFSPSDGATLASGAADGSLLLWNLRPENLRAQGCRAAGRNLTRDEWRRLVGAEVPYHPTCPELPTPPEVLEP